MARTEIEALSLYEQDGQPDRALICGLGGGGPEIGSALAYVVAQHPAAAVHLAIDVRTDQEVARASEEWVLATLRKCRRRGSRYGTPSRAAGAGAGPKFRRADRPASEEKVASSDAAREPGKSMEWSVRPTSHAQPVRPTNGRAPAFGFHVHSSKSSGTAAPLRRAENGFPSTATACVGSAATSAKSVRTVGSAAYALFEFLTVPIGTRRKAANASCVMSSERRGSAGGGTRM